MSECQVWCIGEVVQVGAGPETNIAWCREKERDDVCIVSAEDTVGAEGTCVERGGG